MTARPYTPEKEFDSDDDLAPGATGIDEQLSPEGSKIA